MKSRCLHRIIGLILILPMIGWTITGIIFFIKPGYSGAYEQLAVKAYPLQQSFTIPASNEWQEARVLRSILGHHLLVKIEGKTVHLDPVTFKPKAVPTSTQMKSLLEDALSNNKQRYGQIVSVTDGHAKTSKGIEIEFDWNNLKLKQKGQDTLFINTLYKIHYLRWTPFKGFNQVVGILGLLLLIILTATGIKVFFSNKK